MAERERPRAQERYLKEAVPALQKQFGFKNPMQIPRLEKIVLNVGLGKAVGNPKLIDTAVNEVRAITGQKPVVTRSKKAIVASSLSGTTPRSCTSAPSARISAASAKPLE